MRKNDEIDSIAFIRTRKALSLKSVQDISEFSQDQVQNIDISVSPRFTNVCCIFYVPDFN